MKMISVAMCTYNGERYIEQQLASILSQTRKPQEVVICDDCSSDNTIRIIKQFASITEITIKLIENSINIGSTKNFENAIQLCSGDIIVLSDQDDVWEANKLQVVYDVYISHPDMSLVFTDGYVVDHELNYMGYKLFDYVKFNKRIKNEFIMKNEFEVLLNNSLVTGATIAFNSKYKNIICPIPLNWVHDYWISLVLAGIGQVYYIDKPLIKYRQHNSQQIGIRRHNCIKNIFSKYTNRKHQVSKEYYRSKQLYHRFIKYKSIIKCKSLQSLKMRIIYNAIYRINLKSKFILLFILASTFTRWRHVISKRTIFKDLFYNL